MQLHVLSLTRPAVIYVDDTLRKKLVYKSNVLYVSNDEEHEFIYENFEMMFQFFKKVHTYNAAVMFLDKTTGNVHCLTYNPWTARSNSIDILNYTDHLEDVFYDKMQNLQGRTLKLAQYSNPPKSIIKDQRLNGYDSFLLSIILDKLNATYSLNKYYDNFKSVQRDLIKNNADLTMNTAKSSNFYISYFSTNIYLNEIESICILVPRKNGPIINMLLTPFSEGSLISVGGCMLVFTMLWWKLKAGQENRLVSAIGDILQLVIVGGLPKLPKTLLKKILVTSIMTFSFFLMSSYKSILITNIIESNVGNSDFKTMAELLTTNKNLKFHVTDDLREDIIFFMDEELKKRLIPFDVESNNTRPFENIVDFDNCYILTETDAHLFLNSELNYEGNELRMYLLKEKLFFSLKSISISSESHLEEKLNDLVLRVSESGMAKYWGILSQTTDLNVKLQTRREIESIQNITINFKIFGKILNLYVIFICISTIVFFLEVFIYWLRKPFVSAIFR